MRPGEGVALQRRLQALLQTGYRPLTVRSVAGADISYDRHSDIHYAAVVVLSFPDLIVREEAAAMGRVSFPYVPGLLSFREAPLLLAAFSRLHCAPDAVLVDGQGIAHPRGIGLASHVGLFLEIPTVGCAKSRLVGIGEEPGADAGAQSPLLLDGRTVGTVLRTRRNCRPLFVSPGHLMGLAQAAELVLSCCRGHRLPEPIRLAHAAVNRLRLDAAAPGLPPPCP
jgi:deoxyribonuclease V